LPGLAPTLDKERSATMICPPRWVQGGTLVKDQLREALIAGDAGMAVEHAKGLVG
jgi:hypothetical protein